jgi:hypothetical protein
MRLFVGLVSLALFGTGCKPKTYADWPAQESTFPWVSSPDPDLPEYAHTRWETETWSLDDVQMTQNYILKYLNHYTTAPREVVAHFEQAGAEVPRLGPGIVLSFVGDLLWVGDNWSDFARGAATLNRADLRMGNLETAMSSTREVSRGELPVRFNAPATMLDALPFDVLQLTNNHALDMDDEGTTSTKENVLARGYAQTGINEHLTVTVKGHQVALLSFTWGVNRRDYLTAHELFIVPFGHLGEPIDLSSVATQIAQARTAGAEYVVLMLHWGFEYEHYPDPHFLKLARQMIALGADVIAAEHPHVVQPAEICWVNHQDRVPGVGTCSIRTADGKPRRAAVLYSLGNFSNDAFDRVESNVGIVAKVSLDAGEVTGMGWTPTYFQVKPPRVEPLEAHLDQPAPAEEFARLKKHLGDGWRIPAP